VETASRDGILTSASLMVGGSASADAVARARRLPALKVGLHIVLVEGLALSPPARVPALVHADGRFRDNMALAAVRIFADPQARRQLAAEITAQFEAYAATGLPLDHVDCHKHFHLHPTIARSVIAIGRRFGMKALRVPAEPAGVLRRIEPLAASPLGWLTGAYANLLRHRVRHNGLRAPDRVFGLAWSGAMHEARLRGLVAQVPEGVSEIYLHPATSNAFAGAVAGYRYTDELAALTAPSVRAAVADRGIVLKGYSGLL
jgi:hopanoid biosynthesis associated protein HpnK